MIFYLIFVLIHAANGIICNTPGECSHSLYIGSVPACKDSWHAYLRLIDGNQICLEKTSMFTLSVFQNTAILL